MHSAFLLTPLRPAPQRHVLPATSRRTATGSWFEFTGASVFPGSGASSSRTRQSCAGSEELNRRRKAIIRNQDEEAGAAALEAAAIEEFVDDL